MINSRVKSINTFHLAIGWPITWFTAVQQSNAVNGVVRRFSYSSGPKSLETTVCYLSHTFLWEASPWLDSILDLAFVRGVCFWIWVEIHWSGMVSGATPDIWWQEWVGSLNKMASTWCLWLRLGMANWEQAGVLDQSFSEHSSGQGCDFQFSTCSFFKLYVTQQLNNTQFKAVTTLSSSFNVIII